MNENPTLLTNDETAANYLDERVDTFKEALEDRRTSKYAPPAPEGVAGQLATLISEGKASVNHQGVIYTPNHLGQWVRVVPKRETR